MRINGRELVDAKRTEESPALAKLLGSLGLYLVGSGIS